MITNLYDTTKALQIGVVSPTGDSLCYQFDGALLKKLMWTGPNGASSVKGNVAFTYNSDLLVSTEIVIPRVGGADSVNLKYDKDGLITSAGAQKLRYGASNNLLLSDTLAGVVTDYAYNAFGELTSKEARFGSNVLFRLDYLRDSLGRITTKTEVVQGVTTKYGYVYDAMGRLHQVSKNDTLASNYEYDANGNRLSRTSLHDGFAQIDSASYDAQDRLVKYSNTSYSYSSNGDLHLKVQGTDTTRYIYDAFGTLRSVQMPNGTLIEYVIDGNGLRMGRKVNGALTHKWLYSDNLRVIAELDTADQIISRFVYTTSDNVPEYMVTAGATYRILSDRLGSPRLVVNSITGAVIQQIEYDEFGELKFDSNLGLTPFGFAGGLRDIQTQLTRFGSRDYDAHTGRWTTKDPIRFVGRSENLYRYASADPVNKTDPSGQWAWWDHFDLTFSTMIASGYTAEEAVLTALYDVKTDIEYRDKRFAPIHGMRRADQSLESAQSEASSFIVIEIGKGTFKGLGHALHTVQDVECPQHAWNVWDPEDTISHSIAEILHFDAAAYGRALKNSIELMKQWRRWNQ